MSAKGSELKRVRQSIKSNLTNRAYKSQVNTLIKKVLAETKKKDAESSLKEAVKLVKKKYVI